MSEEKATAPSNIIIRAGAVGEQKTLEALQRRASLTNDGDRNALLANPDAISVPVEQLRAGRVWVAEVDGLIAGFCALEPREDGQTELDALFVEPGIRRRGVGRLMVEHCVEISRKRGSTSLHVIGNPHAEDFYLDCGFQQIGIAETRFGPGLRLRKEL